MTEAIKAPNPIKLPASQLELHPANAEVASQAIANEQWLERHGLRGLCDPRGEQFSQAAARLQALLNAHDNAARLERMNADTFAHELTRQREGARGAWVTPFLIGVTVTLFAGALVVGFA